MGRDKASLPWPGGGRLVDRVVAVLGRALEARGLAPIVLVSGDVEGQRCIADTARELGPVGGMAAVLEDACRVPEPARPTALLFVPVDLPALTEEALLPLLAGGVATRAYHGEELPALVLASPESLDVARALCRGPASARSVRCFLELAGVERLPLPPGIAPALRGANTPGEFAAAGFALETSPPKE